MSDEPLNFEEHRRRREENAGTVRCARCGKWIVATATKCPECGVNFQGEAQDFVHASERDAKARSAPTWVLVAAALLLVAILLASFR
jgi:phage FluMu protein Com